MRDTAKFPDKLQGIDESGNQEIENRFCYTSQLKTRKICEEIVCFTTGGSQMCRGFEEHDLITRESKAQVVSQESL